MLAYAQHKKLRKKRKFKKSLTTASSVPTEPKTKFVFGFFKNKKSLSA
jgi:hypothetical protein